MDRPFRWEVNVQTGVRRQIELTDAEIADGLARKAIEDAAQAVRLAEETRKAKRQAILEKLLDAEEAKIII